MISAQVLANLRARTAQFLTETCTIEVEVTSVGEWGQPVPMWTPVASDVPCRVITATPPTHPASQQVGGQEQIVTVPRIVVPYNTALATNQRITVSDGTVWQVVGLVTDRTDKTDAQAIVARAR